MERSELIELERLLEKMNMIYGEKIHNDRYIALMVTLETVSSLILTPK